jgi:GAF domain-containing protein
MSQDSKTSGSARRQDHALTFLALADLLLDTPSMQEFLGELADLAAQILTPPAACGITFYSDGSPFTAASSDMLANQVDEIQYDGDQGPCLDTLRSGVPNHVKDLANEERWGNYRTHALAHGVRGSLSMPLRMDGETVGALNLYSRRVDAFTDEDLSQAHTFAAQAEAALTLAYRQAKQAATTEQLQEALRSRAVIDQALGIIMAQQHCDAREAFALLRRASQNRNRKIRDISADIIAAVSGKDPVTALDFDEG